MTAPTVAEVAECLSKAFGEDRDNLEKLFLQTLQNSIENRLGPVGTDIACLRLSTLLKGRHKELVDCACQLKPGTVCLETLKQRLVEQNSTTTTGATTTGETTTRFSKPVWFGIGGALVVVAVVGAILVVQLQSEEQDLKPNTAEPIDTPGRPAEPSSTPPPEPAHSEPTGKSVEPDSVEPDSVEPEPVDRKPVDQKPVRPKLDQPTEDIGPRPLSPVEDCEIRINCDKNVVEENTCNNINIDADISHCDPAKCQLYMSEGDRLYHQDSVEGRRASITCLGSTATITFAG
jgi:hypothetical protein